MNQLAVRLKSADDEETSNAGDDYLLSIPWRKPPSRRSRQILIATCMPKSEIRPTRIERRARLVSAIDRGRRWLDEIVSGSVTDVQQIASRQKCSVRQVNMTISLAFLAPDLVRAAVEGRLPRGIGVERASGQYDHLARVPLPGPRQSSDRRSFASRHWCRAAPRRSRGMEPTVRNPRIESTIGPDTARSSAVQQTIPERRLVSSVPKFRRRERNFSMQRPEANNPPERPLLSAETGNVENVRQDPRRNGLFSIDDGFRGSGRLDGGVRSRIRTRLSGDSTLETAAIRCFPLSLVKTGNSNPKDFGFRACYP